MMPKAHSLGVSSTPRLDESEVNSSSASNSEYGLSRRDTDQILDYYQSEDAGRIYVSSHINTSYPESHSSHHETLPASAQSAMGPSTSSSVGRDSNGNPGRISMESVASSSGGVQRRTSQRSAGGADKRRLAIVELDTESQMSALGEQRFNTSHSLGLDVSLLARRGVDGSRLGSLAIVGPPDAQSLDFTGLSPIPVSAPAIGVPPTYQDARTEPFHSGHQRSMSEAPSLGRKAGTKRAPRDVGIVGTLGSMHSGTQEKTAHSHRERQRPSTSEGHAVDSDASSNALTAPVFQTPRSRSPSPLPLADVPPSSDSQASDTIHPARDRTAEQQLTPRGPEKDTGRSAICPVVLDLTSGQPIFGRSPHTTTNGLPAAESQMSTSHSHADRDTQRTSDRLPFKPNRSGPLFLHYQPGVHATAGPLPSPPRHILTPQSSSPPPRPPRVLSPPPTRKTETDHTKNPPMVVLPDESKSILVTSKPLVLASLGDSDYSISAISASSSGSDEKLPALSSSALSENATVPKLVGTRDQTDKPPLRNGNHVREGAFPHSSVFLAHPSQAPPSPSQHQNLDELVASIGGPAEHEGTSSLGSPVSSVAVLPSPKYPQGRLDLKRENSWVTLSAESFGGGPDDTSPPSSYSSSPEESMQAETTAVGSDGLASRRPHRRTGSLRRMSSLLSIPRSTRSQASSPSSHTKKAPSSWPDSMNFSDVLAKKTASDRALAYAAKIRELATERTGLHEWLLSVKKERRDTTPATSYSAATSRVVGKQVRHVSRNSMASEVTFPIRQDSYTATDLSPRLETDLSPPTSPTIVLPYPYLAQGVGIRKRSSRSLTVDSSVTSLSALSGSSRSLGSGFFSSIGRKSSIKKDRPFPSTSANKQTPQPRPIKIGAPPTLPGGPRAPARSTRAQSVVFKSPEPPRSDGQVLSMPSRATVESPVALDQQVEKLHDLLPHASKEILAGYLRRAHNQDPMLAIGTYLEDEKQGRLRHD